MDVLACNTGQLGFLVTESSGTGSNSLYDALVGNGVSYSNVIFDSSLDGQVCALVSGSSIAHEVLIDGNGTNSTYLTDFPAHTGVMTVRNVKITGRVVGSQSGASGSSSSSNRWENILIDGNNYLSLVCWRGGTNRISNCTITANNDSKNNKGTQVPCFSLGNTSITDCKCYTKYFGSISQSNSHSRFTNCLFAYAGTVDNQTTQISNNSSQATVHLSGCTFNQYNNINIAGSTSYVQFEDTNIVNGEVGTSGVAIFADGATVTSTIPPGSTIGTGVISTQTLDGVCTNKSLTLEGVMITGATTTGAIFYIGNSGTITLKNCNITGNLTHQLNGGNQGNPVEIDHSSGKAILENVTISGNTTTSQYSSTADSVFCRGGTLYVTSITTSAAITFHVGVAIISGDNTFRFSWASTVDSSCRIVLTPNSIVRTTQSSTTCLGTSMFYVGTYDEATGAITTTGTATVVLNGTTVSISGSGTMIDANGLHS